MSARQKLSTFDDTALEALAPKGIVRRARRDLEAGRGNIIEESGQNWVVIADGETVRINEAGPARAVCTCPATGICRHILLAVMTINAGDEVTSPQTPASPTASQTSEDLPVPAIAVAAEPVAEAKPEVTAGQRLLELTEPQIRSFAGSELAAAIQLVAESASTGIEEVGANLRVSLEGGAASVMFMAAAKGPALLKEAAFKGPKSASRRVVTAAALLARASLGAPQLAAEASEQPRAEEEAGPAEALDQAWLDDTARTIAEAARMTLAGSAELGADLLFERSIAARLGNAPRLMSLLRGLSRQAAAAARRAIDFQPERFLKDAATAHSLCLALKTKPDDPELTGVLRRNYSQVAPMDVVFLGAHVWRGTSGSRGITYHVFEPASQQWHSTTNARGAGQDPMFMPSQAWDMPLWGAPAARELAGCSVHLPTPQSDGHGVISQTSAKPCQTRRRLQTLRDLTETGCLAPDFAAAREAMRAIAGTGLKERLAPPVTLIQPARFGEAWFDPINQQHRWPMFDRFGDSMTVVFPADEGETASLVHRNRPFIAALLVQGMVVDGQLLVHPRVAVLQAPMSSNISFVSLTLDPWPRIGAPLPATPPPPPSSGFLSRLLGRRDPDRYEPATERADQPHAALASAAIEALVARLQSGRYPATAQDLANRCDAAGLATLARLLNQAGTTGATARQILAAAWMADQILQHCAWEQDTTDGANR